MPEKNTSCAILISDRNKKIFNADSNITIEENKVKMLSNKGYKTCLVLCVS